MKLNPQTYVTSTLAEALADECDAVQLKYRGLWCRVSVADGQAFVYDPHGELMISFDTPTKGLFCTLIGDYFGPPKHELSRIVIWDCWSIGQWSEEVPRPEHTLIETYTYRDRYAFVKHYLSQIGLPLVAAPVFPIAKAAELWDGQDAGETCGLVYRRTRDKVNVTLRIARKYVEVPGALP